MYCIEIKRITKLDSTALSSLISLCDQLPEFDNRHSLAQFQQRLLPQKCLVQFIYVENELAGFKVAYALNQTRLYSWLGGVLPDFRQMGLAQLLLTDQEHWALANDFSHIEVKTLNKFKPMLSLLVKNDYQMTSITPSLETISTNKLHLQKLIKE